MLDANPGVSARVRKLAARRVAERTPPTPAPSSAKPGRAMPDAALHRQDRVAAGRLSADLEILRARGLADAVLLGCVRDGHRSRCAPARLLLTRGLITTEAYYSAFAEACGLRYLPPGSFRSRHPHAFPPPDDCAGPVPVGRNADGETMMAIAPVPESLPRVLAQLKRFPDLGRRICIVSPDALREAIQAANPAARLAIFRPEMSARTTVTRAQVGVVCAVAGAFVCGLALTAGQAAVLASLMITAIAMFPGTVRIMAALTAAKSPMPRTRPTRARLPLYSVLVPLYREAGIVPDLVGALARMRYPRARHEVLFLLEANDTETRAVLEPCLEPHMRIIIVPPGTPRTKPRALCHGLAVAHGELIAVYDGEDRPDPFQLYDAASRFAEVATDVAALQAHLAIDHASPRFFPRQFRFEYAGLFDCLLPFFSARCWPFPLGGTSNHFRRDALEAVGGWDPYNVTEDADLAVRLLRAGYRLETIASTTFEEAPMTWRSWHHQRTRWLKGWLQVMLVALRDPLRLSREIGRARLGVLLAYLAGMISTLAVHPIFVALLCLYAIGIARPGDGGWVLPLIMSIAGASVTLSCGATALLMIAGARRRGWRVSPLDIVLIPAYWLAQSLAFYHAVVEIVVAPHRWAKTEHGLAVRPSARPKSQGDARHPSRSAGPAHGGQAPYD